MSKIALKRISTDGMKIIYIALLICITTLSFGQTIVKRDGLSKMDKGAEAMADEKYTEADQLFREALGMLDKIPSDLAYYFGRNSYHLNNYKQAINWLTKYVQLKGTSGKFYKEAAIFLDRATEAYRKERKVEVESTKVQLLENNRYDCPGDFVLCPVCQGSGVLITPGKFGGLYQTCPASGLDGKLTCDEYNLYIRGELHTVLE